MKHAAFALVASLLLAGCSLVGIRSGYEQPSYVAVDALADTIDVRRYAPRLAVEATVAATDYEEGQNAAFRLLFDYISGANTANENIAMTAPVETAQAGEEIAMTAPVETARLEEGRMRMRFFLPSEYALETAPQPTDPRLRLVALPEQLLAVSRFSGFAGAASIEAQTRALSRALARSPWRATSTPVAYSYDPPWTLPFFRRNEVVVLVEGAAS